MRDPEEFSKTESTVKEMQEAGIREETPRDARKAQLRGLALSGSAALEDPSPGGAYPDPAWATPTPKQGPESRLSPGGCPDADLPRIITQRLLTRHPLPTPLHRRGWKTAFLLIK